MAILLSLTPFFRATRLRGDDENEIAKQHRLFTKMNNWPFPLSEMLGDEQMMGDESQPDLPNPEVVFIDDLTLKQRLFAYSAILCVCACVFLFLIFICLATGKILRFSSSHPKQIRVTKSATTIRTGNWSLVYRMAFKMSSKEVRHDCHDPKIVCRA